MGPLTKALASHLPLLLKCDRYPDKKGRDLDCVFTHRIGSDTCPEATRDVIQLELQLSGRLLIWQVEGAPYMYSLFIDFLRGRGHSRANGNGDLTCGQVTVSPVLE